MIKNTNFIIQNRACCVNYNLFIYAFATLSTIAPFVPYFTIYGNMSAVDIFVPFLLFWLAVFKNNRIIIPWQAVLIFIIALIALVSLTYNYLFSQYVDGLHGVGQVIRWFYFGSIVVLIINYIQDVRKIIVVYNAIMTGLIVTLLYAWYGWYNSPVHFGGIPMLHVIDFDLNRNYLGYFLSLGSVLSYSMFFISKNTVIKYLFLLIFFLFLFSTVLTFSKGALLSVFIALLTYFNVWFVAFIVIALLLFGNYIMIIQSNYVDRFTTSSYNDERLQFVLDAILAIFNNPLLGVGPGNYKSYSDYVNAQVTTDPHNALLWVGAESGLLVVLIILIIIIWLTKHGIFGLSKNPVLSPLRSLIIVNFLNIPIHGLTFSMKYFWISIGLLLSINFISKKMHHSSDNRGSY